MITWTTLTADKVLPGDRVTALPADGPWSPEFTVTRIERMGGAVRITGDRQFLVLDKHHPVQVFGEEATRR